MSITAGVRPLRWTVLVEKPGARSAQNVERRVGRRRDLDMELDRGERRGERSFVLRVESVYKLYVRIARINRQTPVAHRSICFIVLSRKNFRNAFTDCTAKCRPSVLLRWTAIRKGPSPGCYGGVPRCRSSWRVIAHSRTVIHRTGWTVALFNCLSCPVSYTIW